jgi:hypothetical protein
LKALGVIVVIKDKVYPGTGHEGPGGGG